MAAPLEVDKSHGVHRQFHMYNSVDTFPLLDGDIDLSNDAISSKLVKKIFPTVQEQSMAKNIKQFIDPDSSVKDALPRVKKFLKEQSSIPVMAKGTKGGGPATVTEQFYTMWQDEFPPSMDTPMPPREVPPAPQGPSSSEQPHTTMRSASVTIEEIVSSVAPLECKLRTKALGASEDESITHKLEVKTELDVVRNGTAGDVTYMVDKDTNAPFRGEVERVQCDRLAMPRCAMYVRNLTLTSLLASLSKELTSTARDVVTTDCGVRKMVETYDVAMNAAPLTEALLGCSHEKS